MQRIRTLAPLAAAFWLPLPTQADSLTTAPVVVTATRTAQTADETLASVTVITRDEILRSQAVSVDELLRRVPGIQISRNGGYGKTTNVYLRGTEADHVLVLVDGVRAASATLGSFAWQNLRPEQIERIEIVRGPRASLYGSDAIGGVVQIFTRRASRPSLEIGAGGNALTRVEASAGFSGRQGSIGVTAGRLREDGIPILQTDTTPYGFSDTDFTLSADATLPAQARMRFRASQSKGRNELDPFTGNLSFTNRVLSLQLDQVLSEGWSHRITLGKALDRSTSHSITSGSTITTRRTQFSWQHDFSLGEQGLLTAGFDHWIDRASKDRNGLIHARVRTNAFFAQWQQQTGLGDLQAALRHDRNSASGNKTTWNLGWGRELGGHARLFLSHGTAFKAPTVNDLYWPYNKDVFFGITYITEGNPDLSPEASRTTELGLRGRLPFGIEAETSLYYTKVRDLIDWSATQTGPSEYTYRPVNLSRVRIRGLELSLDGHYREWRAHFVFNLTDAKDQSGQQLDRRPLHSASLDLSHPLLGGEAGLEILARGARQSSGGSVRLGGYGLVNLRYQRRLLKEITFSLRAENLFDKRYSLASSFSGNYAALGRTLYLSLRWQPR